MLKFKVYIDTSVIGGWFDDEFAKYSNLLFNDFIVGKKIAVVSNLTLKELKDAPENVRKKFEEIPKKNVEFVGLSEEAEELAQKYIETGVISSSYLLDAEHIAIATVEKIDILASWNFKHIVNINKIRGFNSVNIRERYQLLEIRTPMEVIDENQEI
ncbi:MAG: PIN domain protein [Nitrospinae bacterium RIFCSPLOWO2_01_FULL_39_10]|nr:MAG: PIN domain protein [Nitrospinae bacterium RIFCSPLOWO2_01_FULL_39_10]